jgi:hypothetical protein
MTDRPEERLLLLLGRGLAHYPVAFAWPVVFGGLGYFWAFIILGHPHAWQVMPILGVAFGVVLSITHAAFLCFFRRRDAQPGAAADRLRPASRDSAVG